MGKRDASKQAGQATMGDGVAIPTTARDPGPETAAALLAGIPLDDEYVVASIVYYNPRHASALLGYLSEQLGNTYVERIYDQLDWMEAQWKPDTDHAKVQGRAGLATKGGGDAGGSAPLPTTRLPYDTSGGWDAVRINAKLGQADQIAGTDSDGARCAYAVALAGQIFQGPKATATWLAEFMHSRAAKAPTPRQATAALAITHVAAAIGAGTATYGDLSWAQESLHAHESASETEGTSDSKDVVVPTLEAYTPLGNRCVQSADAVVKEAGGLAEGERLMMVLKYIPNTGQFPADLISADMLASNALPAGVTEADVRAHQVLIARHQGELLWYDPETEAHLAHATASAIGGYFNPLRSLATVVMLQGKVTPKGAAAPTKR